MCEFWVVLSLVLLSLSTHLDLPSVLHNVLAFHFFITSFYILFIFCRFIPFLYVYASLINSLLSSSPLHSPPDRPCFLMALCTLIVYYLGFALSLYMPTFTSHLRIEPYLPKVSSVPLSQTFFMSWNKGIQTSLTTIYSQTYILCCHLVQIH